MGRSAIWLQARDQLAFPGVEVVEILDFYHASQHLAQAAAAVYGAQSEVGKQWLDKHCHLLRHQGVAPVATALADLQAQDAAGEETLRRVRAYVQLHAARLDYPAFRARLFPLGSGAIESTVKNVMQQRQVLAGMRWTCAGAHAVANLRALHRSVGSWLAFWQSQPLRRVLPALPPPVPVEDHGTTALLPHQAAPPLTLHAGCHDVPPQAPCSSASRIRIDGKPWAKGKHYWARAPISHSLPA